MSLIVLIDPGNATLCGKHRSTSNLPFVSFFISGLCEKRKTKKKSETNENPNRIKRWRDCYLQLAIKLIVKTQSANAVG
jgi:hypothetical protein